MKLDEDGEGVIPVLFWRGRLRNSVAGVGAMEMGRVGVLARLLVGERLTWGRSAGKLAQFEDEATLAEG